jgi:hypothetical protein
MVVAFSQRLSKSTKEAILSRLRLGLRLSIKAGKQGNLGLTSASTLFQLDDGHAIPAFRPLAWTE